MRGWSLIDANVAAFVHHSWIGSVGTQQSDAAEAIAATFRLICREGLPLRDKAPCPASPAMAAGKMERDTVMATALPAGPHFGQAAHDVSALSTFVSV